VEAQYAFISAYSEEFSVEALCRTFGVSRSGYYAWLTRPRSARCASDEELLTVIEQIYTEKRQRYGAVRIHRQLRRRGWRCSKKRVARLMRQRGLKARRRRTWVRTTDSRHALPIAKNVLNREFDAGQPNQKWAGDITYVPTSEGWLYLAVVIDLFSRRVIGWSMSNRIDQLLARSAMLMALRTRRPNGALIVHSDRGVQYAAGDYQQLLADWSVTPSMSRKGNCWDNAVSESFFATLKNELVHHEQYRTREEAQRSIFEYIEIFYNRERLHSTLNYCSPVEFEQEYLSTNLCPL
jgi:putative transposase